MTGIRRRDNGASYWPLILSVIVIALLYVAREILIPLALAFTLTFFIAPAVELFHKIKLPRIPAVLFLMLLVVIATLILAWTMGNQLLQIANELPAYQTNIQHKLESLRLTTGGALGRTMQSVEEIESELAAATTPSQEHSLRPAPKTERPPTPVRVVDTNQSRLQALRETAGGILQPLSTAGMVLIFATFMLIRREDLRDRLLRLAGLGQLNVMTQALDEAAFRVSRYLILQVLVNAGFGLIIGLGLYLLKLPHAALWGILAAILRIIPYVGTIVAGTLPLILALAVFEGWHRPLLVFVLFASIELILGNAIEPWLYGVHTGISSLALLVSTVFWTVLWGPVGLVLSTPLTVCLFVLGRYVPQLSFLHIMLGDEPVLTADAQFYQRLLAMDLTEAHNVIDTCLKDRPLAEVYDTVLLPALSMAEQDRHKGALDQTREDFIFQSVSELVSEFDDFSGPVAESPIAQAQPEAQIKARYTGFVLCIPAADQADAIAASMLQQILAQSGVRAKSLPMGIPFARALRNRSIESTTYIISSVPPFAFPHARETYQRLRSRYPQARIIVGIWGFEGDMEKARRRLGEPAPDQIATSLRMAIDSLAEVGIKDTARVVPVA